MRVNFGVFAGRNATPAEIDDLAHALREDAPPFTIVAEERHEFGNDVEASVHQVVIEIDRQSAGDDPDVLADRVVVTANRWASACVAERADLGELGELGELGDSSESRPRSARTASATSACAARA